MYVHILGKNCNHMLLKKLLASLTLWSRAVRVSFWPTDARLSAASLFSNAGERNISERSEREARGGRSGEAREVSHPLFPVNAGIQFSCDSITIITLFESQIILAEHECCTNWGDRESNISNQIKCWFLRRGKTGVPGEKPLGAE